jgi:uncharacterized damage-inducible protein DinB
MSPSPKQQFLDAYDRELATTMRVLRSYPESRLDLQPHEKCKNARDLAWVFVAERGLAEMVLTNKFPEGMQGEMPQPPESWDDLLRALESASAGYRALVEALPEERMGGTVPFFTGPKTIGEIPLMDFLWMMLNDEIHHRGQFSIYLRMADGRVPSIYGPSADEPWD